METCICKVFRDAKFRENNTLAIFFLNLENTVVTQCLVLKGLTPNRVYEEQVGIQIKIDK